MKAGTKQIKSVFIATLLGCFMLMSALSALANSTVVFDNNRLSLNVSNVSLSTLLVQIGSTTGVDIYLSNLTKPGTITLQTENLSVEDSFKRILKEYSYTAAFTGKKNDLHIDSIKIFPKGKTTGELVSLVQQEKSEEKKEITQTILITDGKEMPFTTGLPDRGIMATSASLTSLPAGSSSNNAPWIILQQQFAVEQTKVFQEQLLLQQQIEATDDGQKREALAILYAEQVIKFQEMQVAHANQIESIRRIYNARAAEENLAGNGKK